MKHPLLALAALSLVPVTVLAASGAAATDTEAAIRRLEQALATQEQQIAQQGAELEAQRAEIAALRAAVAKAPQASVPAAPGVGTAAAAAPPAEPPPRLALVAGRPTITSADGGSSIALRGIVNLDAAFYDQQSVAALTDYRRGSVGSGSNRENDAARDLSSGTNFRRARIGLEGTFMRDFRYKIVTEFGGSGAEAQARLNDGWIAYTGFAPFTVQLGAFAPTAGMDDSTSPEDSLFIERAAPAELARANVGADGRASIAVRGSGTRWMGGLALTGGVAGEAEAFDEQRALIGRLGVLALTGADYNVHLGVSGNYVLRPADQGVAAGANRYTLRLRDRPELRVDGTRLIDTGPIAADGAWSRGLEFGANWRNFYLQAEGFQYGIERRDHALEDPEFSGWYAQGSWILTGESRRYNIVNGSFQNLKPAAPFGGGGWGAWELAWRVSHVDLDFAAGAAGTAATPAAVRGGSQDILSLGLNWTPNANLRFLLDYMKVDVDRLNPATATSLPFGPAPATPPVGVDIGQDLDIYTLRMQLGF